MKKSLKAKWLKALRSEKYKQAKEVLELLDHNGKVIGNCCLGVLCKIAGPEYGIKRTIIGYNVVKFNSNEALLNGRLLEKVGLTKDQQEKLSSMNDGTGYGFKRIANWIEKNIPATK